MTHVNIEISVTFTAQVLTTGGVVVAEQLVEYSAIPASEQCENHTCVIFSNLTPQTNYNINVVDGVGNGTGTTSPIETCENSASYVNEKNIQLLGTSYFIPTTLCTQTWSPQSMPDGKGGKCIRFDPELQAGECVRVCLCGWTDIAPHNATDSAVVNVWKRPTPTTNYSIV
ncbi:unnamed protein product, partial [marine sediment metagenome]